MNNPTVRKNRSQDHMRRLILVSGVLVVFVHAAAIAQSGFARTMLEEEVFHIDPDSALVTTTREWSADTGSFLVPEVRHKEGSRNIRIPVQRIRALHEENKGLPVFWLSGGPGQSNMHSFEYDYFIDYHDHIMVGYRGVDGEVSLDCPEIVEILEQGGDILSEEIIRQVSEAYGTCADRLTQEGVDIDGYTPLDVADDIEAARELLGYERIVVVAESYGTRIGYFYARKYPEHLESLVMIGANPPGHMVWDPRQNDRLLRRYADLWKADPQAVSRHPDLAEAFRTVEEDFPTSWLFFPIYRGTVRASMNAFLFHTGTAVQGIDAFVAAANGDASGLWLISFVGSGIFPTVVNWGDNASKAMSADFEPGHDYRNGLDPEGALFGAPLGAFLWSAADHANWPIRLLPDEYRHVQQTDVRTLFLSGSLDLSTPAENTTNEFMPKFPNGVHIIVAEAGHILDLWRSQPLATKQLLSTFIDSGRIDSSGFRHKPVSFDVSWGFPILAKITVGGVLFLVLLLITGVYYGIRRFMRNKRSAV